MQPTIYARHTADCPHQSDKFWRKCKCRKWIYLSETRKRISAGTRSWEQAERKAKQISGAAPKLREDGQTVLSAVESYLADKAQQSLSKSWTYKITREMNNLKNWCERKAILLLQDISLQNLEQYRQEWTGAAISRRKRQDHLRSFYGYCIRHRWVTENTASFLSPIKVTTPPTMPLTAAQFKRVLERAAEYNPKAPDGPWRRQRAIAMLLLLRWSGLRINDAARLERTALTERGSVRLYMQKTGEGVYVPLPSSAVKALRKLKSENSRYFFWNGTSSVEGPGKRWWSTLKKIFKAAGVPKAHPHMLRDTFAIECLLAGVPLDQVSILLGHSSIKITERHYSPWVRARQKQLEESIRKSWAAQKRESSGH